MALSSEEVAGIVSELGPAQAAFIVGIDGIVAMNDEIDQCRQAFIAAILAVWESEIPEPEKSLAKAMAGEYRDTIVVISSRPDIVMSDYRQRNVFANSSLWRPYWATFVPLAVIAKERLSGQNDAAHL